ncbi:MerR family transcriptional regulator [Herbivorax sp. ANBcel31]|uniref:MerR family transcriptional regulator n=1 Tax=Herbivorax sp. ANBcel31 TaxID=3069754 RepID=UPI0027B1A8BF|nr:MerR family transcriptional regulator [Herbivorax sp. ANBcel31]MDQ2085108.1 MerR family transcriptional regulator [Herbivorax sp. ANBcel31]
MDVRNCKSCGKIFNHLGGYPICPTCKKKDEEDFQRVKDYLYDNPKASIIQVSNELEISVRRIKSYLRDERLEIIGSEGNMLLECEKCGKAISSGRFCKECSSSVVDSIRATTSQMSKSMMKDRENEREGKKKGSGMRYLNRKDR